MPAPLPPTIRVAMRVPVSGGVFDRLGQLGPGLKAAAFERQPSQHLPPGFDQVEVSGIGGLEDKMPARVGQGKKQHVSSPMRGEVVDDGKDRLGFRAYPDINRLQEVDPGKPWCVPGKAA